MASFVTEKFSEIENLFATIGIASTGLGIMNLAEGKVVKGVMEIVLGNYQTTVAALPHSETLRNEAFAANLVSATIPVTLQAFWNACSNQPKQIRRGYAQMMLSASSLVLSTKLSTRILAVLNNTLTIATLSGYAAYSGVQDFAKGKVMTGATKVAFGAGGILLSGLAAYGEIINP